MVALSSSSAMNKMGLGHQDSRSCVNIAASRHGLGSDGLEQEYSRALLSTSPALRVSNGQLMGCSQWTIIANLILPAQSVATGRVFACMNAAVYATSSSKP